MIERLSEWHNYYNYFFLFLLLLIVILKQINSHKFMRLLSLGWSNLYIKEAMNTPKKEYSFQIVLLLLFFLMTLQFILLINVGDNKNQTNLPNQILNIQHFIFFISLICLKYMMQLFVAYIFNVKQTITKYLKLKYNMLYYLSIISYFPLLFFYYASIKIQYIEFFLLVIFIIYILKLLFYYSKLRGHITNHLYYFILYICTFEIIPLYLIFRYIE